MKILHTADWHVGRVLHGIDRTPEIRAVLKEVLEIARQQEVDLILVAGDVFDGKNPSALAEDTVFGFFQATAEAGIPSVVIAGNHDSPNRLDAFSGLLQLARVHVVGNPRVAGQGGLIRLSISGQPVCIAALPFVSERRLVRVTQLLEGDAGTHRETYQQSMRKLIANLSHAFAPDTVNLLMLHATMEGATLANSEYVFHTTADYTLSHDVLPEDADYVALGHIHNAQVVEGMPGRSAQYSGSLVQLDFGEQETRKVVYVLEVRPGRPTEVVAEVPLRTGQQLRRVVIREDELERRGSQLVDYAGLLKLVVEMDVPRPGLKDRIKASLPQVVSVEFRLPKVESDVVSGVDLKAMSALEAYARYYLDKRGTALPDRLREAFKDLYQSDLESGVVP
ncbi:MAG: exonuclease subunit SbcD [Trueperaceae bacterium]|nr:MAG: exonuclease subunit SbcD [Trueperaceae bacterium]